MPITPPMVAGVRTCPRVQRGSFLGGVEVDGRRPGPARGRDECPLLPSGPASFVRCGITRLSAPLHTRVSNLWPIAGLVNLRTLDVANTPVQSLAAVAKLENLTVLDASDTGITGVSWLEGVASLRALDVSYTSVEYLQPMSKLAELTSVNIAHTPVSDIRPLWDLQKLRYVRIPYAVNELYVAPLRARGVSVVREP